MKKQLILIVILFALVPLFLSAQKKPVNPMQLDTWLINAGIGPGTQFWGNGAGFGPALKAAAEKGMWEVGPGVFTLGGEFSFSYFGYKWDQGWKESWANLIFAARSSYHYGWDVPGLDTYAGVPLGIGFSIYGQKNAPNNQPVGWHNHTPVFPYFGMYLGGSYFFNPTLGINTEVGYNSTYATVGMVYRIK